MTNINDYSRKYEIDFVKGVYDKIAKDNTLKKVCGNHGDDLLIRGNSNHLVLILRNSNEEKNIIKIHSKKPIAIQSELESITGVDFSQYMIH